MKRGSRAGGEPTKARRPKTVAHESRVAEARPHSSSIATLEGKVDRLTGELNEALERQRATADILGAISRSKFELQSILQSVVDIAAQLCRAEASVIFRLEGGVYRFAAGYSLIPSYMEHERQNPISPGPGTLIGRAASSRRVVHIEDAWTDPLYEQKAVVGVGRSMLGVPLMHKGEPIGVIGLSRSRVAPFTQREIDLVTTFADQAVIAIENVNLFEAEQQRTRELGEALEQQTATSEVLQVISSSPGELERVFAAMLENAVRICAATFGNIHRWDGEALHLVAAYNTPPAFAEARRRSPARPSAKSSLGRMIATKILVHISDAVEEPGYAEERDASTVAAVELGGVRTVLYVPMLKENELVGAFTLSRQEVRPFTDKQIELIKNFAAQAVIAIENARLLNELRLRTSDLTEALEQQTATSDVLRVISSSPGELGAVFNKMLDNAIRICDAKFGTIDLKEGDGLRLVAAYGVPPAFAASRGEGPFHPAPGGILDTVMNTARTVHIQDLAATHSYIERHPRMVEAVEVAGIRTAVGVPMLRDDELVGIIAIFRREVSPFTDKQIELLSNFAAQAVIAIENARLLNELRRRTDDLSQRTTDLTESLEQQTATSEVLRVISSSAGDLQPVFERVLESATRLCHARFGNLFLLRGDEFQYVASHGVPSTFTERIKQQPRGTLREHQYTPLARVAQTKKVVHVVDLAEDESYRKRDANIVALVDGAGARTIVVVPMFKEDHLVGAVAIYRQEVSPFADKQVELVENFAAQAVIAIENARLLNELRQSLEEQTATSDVL